MKRFVLIGISFIAMLPGVASARVWCENTDKTGFWADKCPTNMVTGTQANEWKPPQQPAELRPYIGMTATEAQGLTFPWGRPDKVNKTTHSNGVREQWIYTDVNGMGIRYLYFQDGVLTSIQE